MASLKVYIINVDVATEVSISKELYANSYEYLVFEKITNIFGLSAISGDSVLIIGDEYPFEDIQNLYEKMAAVSRNPVIFLSKDLRENTAKITSDYNVRFLDICSNYCSEILNFLSDKKNLKVKKSQINRSELCINIISHLFSVRDKYIHLTKTEFNIIHYMMASENMNISHCELMIIFQNFNKKININTLANHIRNINSKIFFETDEKKYIKSIYGFGYGIKSPQ